MTLEECIEKYGKEFTKKLVQMTVIKCDGVIGNWAENYKDNFMHEDCIKAGMFTKRRKESKITIYKGYRNAFDEHGRYVRVPARDVTIFSINKLKLFQLIFTDDDLKKGLL